MSNNPFELVAVVEEVDIPPGLGYLSSQQAVEHFFFFFAFSKSTNDSKMSTTPCSLRDTQTHPDRHRCYSDILVTGLSLLTDVN